MAVGLFPTGIGALRVCAGIAIGVTEWEPLLIT